MQVRHDILLLAGEQRPGPSEAHRNLVGNQQQTQLTRQTANALQVPGWMHEYSGGPLDQRLPEGGPPALQEGLEAAGAHPLEALEAQRIHRDRPGALHPAHVAGVHRAARLPQYRNPAFLKRARKAAPAVNQAAPAKGRKVALYATCFANYNSPEIGEAALAILAHNGVDCEVVYPRCCGMPQLEQGDIARVAENAKKTAVELGSWIDKGYDVVALVPSCALMLKLEWPLLLPDKTAVARLAAHSFDISEYIVAIARDEGLADGIGPLDGGVTLHMACHARAQNIGNKAADMLKLVPGTEVEVIERCSGHGGSIGVTRDFHEIAMKVGKPTARRALETGSRFVASECPLAASHIVAGMERLASESEDAAKGLPEAPRAYHPIELFAKAYGLDK